jgi:TolB-like protein/tetratricopeptide (TPR) repeat protein
MDSAYAFANAEFEPTAGTLTVDGRHSSLRPRSGAVLRCLLDRPRQVVSKDDLLREVWSDLVVTENSLAQCIKEIRRELGDAQEAVLKTVHRRGYVIEADVTRPNAEPRAAALPPGRKLSLVVMPLVNLGGDPKQDYFAEGLTEELTTDLGRLPWAFVISRGTAQALAGRRMDAHEIGRQLGVRYLVEGSVRRGDSEIAANLSLTDTTSAHEVWTDRFQGPRLGLMDLQRSMSARIAQALQIQLMHAEGDRVALTAPNADAYDLATRAWSLWHRTAPVHDAEATQLIDRALLLDPRCTFAWVVKAQTCMVKLASRSFGDWAQTIEEGEHAARTALSIEPDHGTAHTALAALLTFQGKLEEAFGHFERQMSLNPNLALTHHWLGIAHLLMGNAKLAVRPMETSVELSPRDPRLSTFIRNLALAHLHLERDAEGLILAERSVHVPRPWPRSYETLAMAYGVNGLLEEARAAVAVLLKHWPGYSIATHRTEMMSRRPAFLGQRERLLDALRRAGLPER